MFKFKTIGCSILLNSINHFKIIKPSTRSFFFQKSKPAIDFYYIPGSAPCRSVLMTAKACNVDLNLRLTNIMKGEHLTAEFLKLNPQHTIPTLVDNGFVLWESRAILMYLVDKYAKNDKLYPRDPQIRSVVNQRLFFDMGTLYQYFADYYYPVLFYNQRPNHYSFKKMETGFALLNKFLEGQTFIVGNNLTIADISLLSTVSTSEVVNYNIDKYPNIVRWYKHVKSITPGIELNESGLKYFKSHIPPLQK